MRKMYKLLSLFVFICLLIGIVQVPAYADEPTENIRMLEPVALGSVKMKENVNATISNLLVMPSDNHQTVGLTLKIQNNSNTDLNLIDYWVYIYTKSGTKLNVQSANAKVAKIPAKTSVELSYYSTVGNDIKLSDLIVKLIEWDFSAASYMRVLGEIAVPVRYNPTTPAGSGRIVTTDDVSASIAIKKAVIGKSESYYRPDIQVVIKNDGKQTITLPDYQLYIMTNNNLMYPLKVTNLKGTTLNPLTEKEFQLTVSIPISVDSSGWKMAVMYPVNEGKGKTPVALFDLPKAEVEVGDQTGKFYTFTNSKGIYNIRMDSINRLPLEEDDLIISNLTIANKGTETLPVPALSGKYIFNDSIEKAAVISQNDKIVALEPGASVNIQLVGKVHYTFDINKLKLIVQQKESGIETAEEVNDLVEFNHTGEFTAVPKVKWDTGFKVEDLGYRSSIKMSHLKQYEGTTANVISAQMTVTNEEKRQTLMQKLAGYFEKSDGTVYPASFEYIEEKIAPGGTAIINAWTTVPKTVDLSDVRLVVGKAVVESTTSTAENAKEKLSGYAVPYSFDFPIMFEVQQGLQEIDLLSYELSIKRLATQIRFNESQVLLEFDYSLTQDLLKKSNSKEHKVVVELEDANKKSVFSKEFTLPGVEKAEGAQGNQLSVGSNLAEVTWSDVELVQLITTLKDYQFNVYYQIQPGYRTLIATQKIPWLVNRTLD